MVDIIRVCYHIVDSAGKLHDSERMLKPAMSGTWLEQIGQSKLMDMPEPLERITIQDLHLSWLQPDEIMDWVTDLLI